VRRGRQAVRSARTLLAWNGKNWGSVDVPDFKADEDPAGGMGPFIMNPEGVARFFAKAGMAEGRSRSTTSRSTRRCAATRSAPARH
jgi:hypothetical protein